MENSKITSGIIGLLLILTGFGGSQILTSEQLDNAYFCELTQEVGVFDRFSSSMKTGYVTNSDGTENKFACRDGRVYSEWVLLKDYAKEKGINPETLIKPIQEKLATTKSGNRFICGVGKCLKIE